MIITSVYVCSECKGLVYRYGLNEDKSWKCVKCLKLFSMNDVLTLEKAEFDEESYLYLNKEEVE